MINLQSIIPGLTPEAAPADSIPANAASSIAELKSLSLQDFIDRMAQSAVNFAINVALAIVVFYVGRFIIRRIVKLIQTVFLRRQIDKSLSSFIVSLVNIVLYFILIVTIIGILGIETTSFLAIFASAGVAIGMALSGTLQNFAGGVLILLLKPYKVGDYIEVKGFAGTVKEIQIFFTVITTYDNKSISIPNSALSNDSVNNWSRESYRRVSWTVGMSYGDNVDAAREAILKMFDADERIQDTPSMLARRAAALEPDTEDDEEYADDDNADDEEPTAEETAPRRSFWDHLLHRHRQAKAVIRERKERQARRLMNLQPRPDRSPKVFVDALADSSVNLTIRAWTRTANYWDVYYDYNERFYKELPSVGIRFPFPQLDVHLDPANPA